MKEFTRKKIASLPKSVADRIAAGEVVERPLSIVKELVENSIDAGADFITLEIKNGGKTYIRVTDNGCGIPPEEAETAFLRHATSKISHDRDLLGIETLGFRGEALASISAVTRTRMITKVPGEKSGIRISIDGGKVVEKVSVGAADGTSIVVSDLFYNTPVREKFMKKDSAESALVGDFISRLSLAYPEIRFRFINNDKTVFSTNGKGNALENIFTIYGKETGKNLIEVNNSENDLNIKAYISNPLFSKSTRKSQYFFVNGRSVSDKILESGVEKGYGDKVPDGRFPVVFIFLTLPSERVDVNIHPNKKEIRFDRPDEIEAFVRKSVFEALDSRSAIGSVSPPVENIFKIKDEGFSLEEKPLQTEYIVKSGKIDFKSIPVNNETEKIENIEKRDEIREVKPGNQPLSSASEGEKDSEKSEKILSGRANDLHNSITGNQILSKEREITHENNVKNDYEEDVSENMADSAPDISNLNVLGVLFNTYIAASDYNTFYLIDQHAAHERVFYEQFLREFYRTTPASQAVLTPIIKDIPYFAADDPEEWTDFLKKSGFETERFGDRTWIFKAIPAFMDLKQAESFLDDFIENISEKTSFRDKQTVDRIIMRSCKSAVKAHDKLSTEEIRGLLKSLSKCKNPYSCPHGRPVIVKMTEKDMERMFKRA